MPDDFNQTIIFVAGPTASGKTAAALQLADATGGEIVNADALQVYADLRVLSARPGAEEEARAPHHLFGFLDGAERCSAGRWARAAAEAVADIGRRGRPAIVVGGTGLYFRALEDGLSQIPDIPAATRRMARARYDELGAAAFRAEIVARDPALARLPEGDTQRLLRAFEVMAHTGRRFSDYRDAPRRPLVGKVDARVVIEPPRQTLYDACDRRFAVMMAAGALAEAKALAARNLDPALPVMKALGAAELLGHLKGETALDEAVDVAMRNTRRFAKRQLTWFRNQAASWPRESASQAAADNILQQLSA